MSRMFEVQTVRTFFQEKHFLNFFLKDALQRREFLQTRMFEKYDIITPSLRLMIHKQRLNTLRSTSKKKCVNVGDRIVY